MGQEEKLLFPGVLFAAFEVKLADRFYQMEGAAGWDWL